MSWRWVQHAPSTAYTEYSIHWVQHTASHKHCLSSLHSHDYELTLECSFSFQRASLHDRPPSASSPWGIKGKVTLSRSHRCDLTNWWIESQHPAHCPSTASKYSSKLAQLWPPSSHNHGLQVHLQTPLITASKWISKLAWSQPPNSLDHSLQVRTIMASKSIAKLAGSRSRSASLSSLNHGLQVYPQIRSITASKCISKLTRSWPWSVSLTSLDHHFQANLELLSRTACSQFRYAVCRSVAI